MTTSDLSITRGDAYEGDRRLIVNVSDADGAPLDLTGLTLAFMVKQRRPDTDADALVSKATGGNGITIAADQVLNCGLARIAIAEADTSDGPVGQFYAELQAVDSDGPVTLWSGRLTIAADLVQGV